MTNKRRLGCCTIAAEFSTKSTKRTVPTYEYWRPSKFSKGYGESKPIDSNETEDGMQNNRRVEFTIMEQSTPEPEPEPEPEPAPEEEAGDDTEAETGDYTEAEAGDDTEEAPAEE